MEYQLRPARESDLDFLYRLRRATVLEAASDEQQFRAGYHPASYQIITVENEPVGVLSISEKDEELFLERIEILPSHQRRGLGTRVIREVLDRAGAKGQTVRIQVLKTNPHACRLYERLGFRLFEETEVNYRLRFGERQACRDGAKMSPAAPG
jgi:ribosomal protein S18 acetylase RimI-like enzyme